MASTGFPFASEPEHPASRLVRMCDAERFRQWRQLVMIPSESICHPAAAEIVASELGNVYAEGLPQPILCHDPRASAFDAARFRSWQTRLSDRRFYKGTIGANRVELAAQRFIASVFAALDGSPPEDELHANVQPLSGAAANLAVFEALLNPGDRVMGLDLAHGGHLTHGSEFNFSGKTYEVHSYGIDSETRRLDYERIREQAREVRPRLIIGGASAYPWDFDWQALRSIADEVGASLLADVAHLAGLIAGGALMNPLPHAHVVTFTTHKTLCGPRGAVILTADLELGRRMDMAVFPGLQGGPHMNSIAAIGRLFELIASDRGRFCDFQKQVVENCRYFGEALCDEGFALEYGGTDTHMLLVDLKRFPVEGPVPLDGEIASRLLEMAGIVCNKNMLPGDPDAAHATGLRFGLPWLTQRGVTREQLREIASIARGVLEPVRTFQVWSPQGEEKCRGRLPEGVLEAAAARTLKLAGDLPYPPRPEGPPAEPEPPAIGDRVAFLMRGDKVRLALNQMLTARIESDSGPVRARMLRHDGSEMDDLVVMPLDPAGREERRLLLPHAEKAAEVRRRIENLSDGYIIFDPDDLQKKVDGPSVIEPADPALIPADLAGRIASLDESETDLTKPYFIGQEALYAQAAPEPKSEYDGFSPPEAEPRRTPLNEIHKALDAKMAPFAGWEMPIQYPAGILAEHRAVRTAAGLFDVSHMRPIEISGPNALPFLDVLLANAASRLDPGEAQYSYMLYPDGTAVDDVFLYRLERERFMLISNAANADRVVDWMWRANERDVIIDPIMPGKMIDGPVTLKDLSEPGEESAGGLALQGPMSLRILQAIAEATAERASLGRLPPNAFVPVTLGGVRTLVARTGYTGETIGFEIYAQRDALPDLWSAIMEAGRPMGLLPSGLGARDSTRVEAGLPLFGHELEGGLGIALTEAGYGFVVRYHVPFFIGRERYMERMAQSRRHLIRLKGSGRKSLRPGHLILDESQQPVGEVTSFAYVSDAMDFIVLALVDRAFRPEPGAAVAGARIARDRFDGALNERTEVELTALPRFPDDVERAGWQALYSR